MEYSRSSTPISEVSTIHSDTVDINDVTLEDSLTVNVSQTYVEHLQSEESNSFPQENTQTLNLSQLDSDGSLNDIVESPISSHNLSPTNNTHDTNAITLSESSSPVLSVKSDTSEIDETDPYEESYIECAICLQEITHPPYTILENCLHRFHEDCIQEWFQKKGKAICPCCNRESDLRIHVPSPGIGRRGKIIVFDKECPECKESYLITQSQDQALRQFVQTPTTQGRVNINLRRNPRVHPIIEIIQPSQPPLPPNVPLETSERDISKKCCIIC
jgi:hypothetical protein